MPFSCAQKRLESWWMFGRFVQWHLRGCASAKRQWSNSSAAFVMGGGVFELLGTVLVCSVQMLWCYWLFSAAFMWNAR